MYAGLWDTSTDSFILAPDGQRHYPVGFYACDSLLPILQKSNFFPSIGLNILANSKIFCVWRESISDVAVFQTVA
jgi:hypothetical protein